MSPDLPVRLAAFDWLSRQVELHGDVLPWAVLHRGFDHPPERGAAGKRVPLVSQQGIFKPRLLALPLSIRTAVDGPYDDALGHVLHYRYRGADPFHRDNAGLTFTVQLDSAAYPLPEAADFDLGEPRREYVTVTFRRRLHQRAFRERVLSAYRVRCAMCRLRHRELLDAAHIVADRDPAGAPRVSNGLSLCKLHHAAFDSLFVTVDPDYRIVVRRDVLEEKDGPMLRHGLQELHGVAIGLPRSGEWLPSREGLEDRLGGWRAGSEEATKLCAAGEGRISTVEFTVAAGTVAYFPRGCEQRVEA